MAGLAVQLNHLGHNFQTLHSQGISRAHQDRIQKCLVKIFRDSQIHLEQDRFSLKLCISNGKPILYAGDKRVEIPKSSALKELQRVIDFYRHTGQLPPLNAEISDLVLKNVLTQKTVYQMRQASIPGTNGNILAGMRIADDTLSLVRNIMYSIPVIGPHDMIANHLGYYAGIFWSFFSFREFDDGIIELKRSNQIEDMEGKRRAEARILSGTVVSAASTSYLTSKFLNTLGATAASGVLSMFSNVLFGTGSLLATGFCALGAMRCSRFHDRLNEYLDHPDLDEAAKMKAAIQFLVETMSVTEEERVQLAEEIAREHPELSALEKNDLLKKKIEYLTETKVKYMKRRTSIQSMQEILSKSGKIVSLLMRESTQAEGIEQAALLINRVQRDNRIKMSLFTLGMIASIISFVGMVLLTIGSFGMIPLVLYGIAGTIYLSITLYYLSGFMLKKDKESNLVNLHPFQNISKIII